METERKPPRHCSTLPKLSCHDAIKALNKAVMTKPINYIVDVDANINLILARKLRDTLIKKGFFASVSAYQSKGPIVLVIDLLL